MSNFFVHSSDWVATPEFFKASTFCWNSSMIKKSYAVSYIFKDDEKTMTDKDIDQIMSKMIEQYSKQLNAVVRGQ